MALLPRLYNPGPIEPIGEPGDNLLLLQQSYAALYRIGYVESLPQSAPISINLIAQGATIAGGASQVAPVSLDGQIDMLPGNLAQIRFFVGDNIEVSMYQPQSLGLGLTLNVQARVTPFTRKRDPYDAATEQFIFQQQRLYLKALNRWAAVTINMARIHVYGFRYVLEGALGQEQAAGNKAFPPILQWATLDDALAATDPTTKRPYKFTVVDISGWGQ